MLRTSCGAQYIYIYIYISFFDEFTKDDRGKVYAWDLRWSTKYYIFEELTKVGHEDLYV